MNQLIYQMDEKYEGYLHDESGLTGRACTISFPKTEEEAVETIKMMLDTGQKITIQGGKTGISGGAVPDGGHILNLTKMNAITSLSEKSGKFMLSVQPGCTLVELKSRVALRSFDTKNWQDDSKEALEKLYRIKPLMWAPDPTELSATIGGAAATNAQGICARKYGGTRNHINRIRVVTKDAEVWQIDRGKYLFEKGEVILPDGRCLKVNPSHLGLDENADLLDIFLCSEGIFGVITSISVELMPLPDQIWGICFFFEKEEDAISFAEIANVGTVDVSDCLAGLEYLDKASLQCIRDFKKFSAKLQELPDIPECYEAMVYIEIHANCSEQATTAAEWLMAKAAECGSDIDASWAAMGEAEIEKIHTLRHAVSEYINIRIGQLQKRDPNITKLGTNMEFPGTGLSSLVSMYREDLQSVGLEGVIFGHVLNGHLHVNIIPHDVVQYEHGKQLILKWGKRSRETGGKTVVEHGVGKLKRSLFQATASSETLEAWEALKKQLDPYGIWNVGNMLEHHEKKESLWSIPV